MHRETKSGVEARTILIAMDWGMRIPDLDHRLYGARNECEAERMELISALSKELSTRFEKPDPNLAREFAIRGLLVHLSGGMAAQEVTPWESVSSRIH